MNNEQTPEQAQGGHTPDDVIWDYMTRLHGELASITEAFDQAGEISMLPSGMDRLRKILREIDSISPSATAAELALVKAELQALEMEKLLHGWTKTDAKFDELNTKLQEAINERDQVKAELDELKKELHGESFSNKALRDIDRAEIKSIREQNEELRRQMAEMGAWIKTIVGNAHEPLSFYIEEYQETILKGRALIATPSGSEPNKE